MVPAGNPRKAEVVSLFILNRSYGKNLLVAYSPHCMGSSVFFSARGDLDREIL